MTDEAETVLVPTSLAPPLPAAYSDYPDDPDPEPTPAPWRTAWGAAVILLACAGVVAFVIAVVGWASNQSHDDQVQWPPSTVPAWAPVAAPSTVPSPLPVVKLPRTTVTVAAPATTVTLPPSTVVAAPSSDVADAGFIARLRSDQIVVQDRSKAIEGAHWICESLDDGQSRSQVIASATKANPQITELGLQDFLRAAVDFYCPKWQEG